MKYDLILLASEEEDAPPSAGLLIGTYQTYAQAFNRSVDVAAVLHEEGSDHIFYEFRIDPHRFGAIFDLRAKRKALTS